MLFNNPLLLRLYSVDDRQMGKEHCWNDYWQGKTRVFEVKSVPMPLSAPHIPLD